MFTILLVNFSRSALIYIMYIREQYRLRRNCAFHFRGWQVNLENVLDYVVYRVKESAPIHINRITLIRSRCCCYIMVKSAMVASQNGFCSYKLSRHDNNNIIQNMTKSSSFLCTFMFYHQSVVKQYHFMTHFMIYANSVLSCSRCKIHRYSSTPQHTLPPLSIS